MNYGLLTDVRDCPVAVSVHEGNTADSPTLMPEIKRLREGFGIEQLGGTTWQGKAAMRISVSNWQTSKQDVLRSAAAIAMAFQKVRGEKAGAPPAT